MLKLRQLADTDFMTGLMNRRSFLTVADDAVAYCRRYKRNMATLMIDIDHFKKINDTHGHAADDDAIKPVAEIVNQSIRATDKAARFGGEEFVVLLREIDQHESERDVQDVIERADQRLYVAKKTGRNRTFLMPAEDERAARAA
jgi:PleD family two-component response regulator